MVKEEIPIMFCFDNNYVIPAGIAFYSMLKNCNKDYKYSLYVLHTDITKENQQKLIDNIKEFNSFSKLSFINMEHKFASLWETISTKGHFSKEVMYKVLVASIFPQYQKIIVSDVDVVFLNDISESYTSFNIKDDYYLAGVRMIGKYDWYLDIYNDYFTEEEKQKLSGFCGGYIVFNLNKIREDNMEDKFIKCFEENGYRINQMEQDVLNLCCYPKTKRLPLKYVACSYMWDVYKTDEDIRTDSFYNEEEIKDAMTNTVQLHYATSTKPWNFVDSTKSEIWFKYLSQTVFLEDYLKKLPDKIVISKNQRENIISNLSYEEKLNIYMKFKKNINLKNRIKGKLEKYQFYWYLRFIFKNPLFLFKPSFYKKIYKKMNSEKILIFDDIFPSGYSPFRTEEYGSYLKRFDNSVVFTNCKSISFFDINLKPSTIINDYIKSNPEYKGRIFLLNEKNLKITTEEKKIAIVTFLNNTYDILPILNSYKIPFIFTLYPGGGFGLNQRESDEKLRQIFKSKYFRKVIVTQPNVKDYLIQKKLCDDKHIEYIFGVVTPHKILNKKVKEKIYFKNGKHTLDICFVAHKYSKDGKDKGFDIFQKVCEKLINKKNIKFHVVGSFDKNDISDKNVRNKIKFYGILSSEKLSKFYERMDIIISPTVPFILHPGNFDGFPTACSTEAMLNQVVLIATDVLKINEKDKIFRNGKDIIIVNPDAEYIVEEVNKLYNSPELIKKIGNNGYLNAKKMYSYKNQVVRREKLIKKEYKKIGDINE